MFQEFSQAGKMLSVDDEKFGGLLSQALQSYLKDKALALVSGHQENPILLVYSSDATSYLCQTTASHSVATHKFTRKGMVLEEFLMEQGAVHVAHWGGSHSLAVLASQPRPLSLGKKR